MLQAYPPAHCLKTVVTCIIEYVIATKYSAPPTCAQSIARAGARAVTTSARDVEKGAKATTRLVELYPACQFFFVVADVATEEGCSTLAAEADRRMDGIDGLVSIRLWHCLV